MYITAINLSTPTQVVASNKYWHHCRQSVITQYRSRY